MDSQMYTNSDNSWMSSCDQFGPKIVQRRAKRSIPDNDKDDKYWEKRKRNNMAAKRSRECKRQAESDVRNKVSFLEEENALLRKEISLMKAKFGIPLDQSLLSQDDRSQCMHDVRSNRQLQDSGAKSESEDGSDNSIMSPTDNRYSIAGIAKPISPYDRMNGDLRRQQDPTRIKGSEMNPIGYEVYASWNPQIPNDNAYIGPPMFQNGDGKYPGVPQEMMNKHTMYSTYERFMTEDGHASDRAGYEYYGYQSQQPIYSGAMPAHTPADLTLVRKADNRSADECPEFMKKHNIGMSDNTSPLKLPTVKAEYYDDKEMMLKHQRQQHADITSNSGTHRTDLSSSSQDDEYYGNGDSDLKSKLQQLSNHYSELKKC